MSATSDRRGACPSLSVPMATGDGLLVRLSPKDRRLSADQFAGLADAARRFGNGLMEVTTRGNLQIRGLTPAGVEGLADAVEALRIDVEEGVPLDLSPLAGIDPAAEADPRPLAAAIRAGIAARGLARRLGPKVTLVLDDGGIVPLKGLKADVRLTAAGGDAWRLSFGRHAMGKAGSDAAAETALRLLATIAGGGRTARASDWEVAPAFASSEASCSGLTRASRDGKAPLSGRDSRVKPENDGQGERAASSLPLGLQRLSDGALAFGLAAAFGQMEAARLGELIRQGGAGAYLLSPGRMLFALAPADAGLFEDAARSCGFITDPADPRLSIAACAGSDGCASGHIPARRIAQALAARPGARGDLHVSGCAKGCAHPVAAATTVVGIPGGAALVLKGTARDKPARQMLARDPLDAALALVTGRSA